VIRPIRPDDKAALERGFEQLSPASRYRRFLSPMNALTPRLLRYLTEVDHHSHEAIVAESAEKHEPIGVARYVRLSDFTPSPLFPFAIAATNAPAGVQSPPTTSTGPVSIAPILDNYVLDATLTLPVTDYVLRLARGLAAAKHGREAAQIRSRLCIDNRPARLAGPRQR